ncbi:Scr1 family TA system antitoxin-like transcriptional regulator [Actinomadura luteofluorescens]|uniref:Scr1 family TA system antitoxin-like transcriptional regulator n=1 Tax=Actinomadura luteofluorescens TaxID=46163 RepID=UPI0030D14F01
MGAERLQEIGRELRRLRTSAGLSGVGLAARAGVPQPTVSRVETGRRVSDPEVVARLVGALEVGPAEAERLLGLVREAYAETSRRVDAGVSFRSGVGAELLAGARVVRAFEPVVMPRLLWTAEYAAAIGAAVASVSVLDDEGGRFVVLMAEAVLRTWPGSGECMAGQLAHLVEVSGRANVRLGIVPGAGLSRVPLHGFSVYDDAAVSVETFTRELTLTDEDEVRAYVEIFEGFERAAVFGDEARALVDRAADDLRQVLRSIH